MRGRIGRSAQQRWRAVMRGSQRHIAKPFRAAGLVLAAIVGGGLIFALLQARHDQPPAPNVARPSGVVVAPPEKPSHPSKPIEETALRPPPRVPPPVATQPAWLRYAVPAPPTGNRPLVAIVLDDLGLDQMRTAEAIQLRGLLTMSFMTYASELAEQTAAARRAGHELFLHVPMEAVDRHADPGPHALFTTLAREQILERLRWGLGRFDGFVGINNHMGSKFTADGQSMAPVMEELRARGLAFLDSRTSPASAGIRLAVAYGVPHAARDVFLDDDQTASAIAKQLVMVEQVARQRGSAIAIGHPHDQTIAALKVWLPQLGEKGLALVPVSAVVQYRMAEEGRGKPSAP
jgi:polysaccharide deacetylase 2 family uncharacterized protein YibQ